MTSKTATFDAGPLPTSIIRPSGCDGLNFVRDDTVTVESRATTYATLQYPVTNNVGATCSPSNYRNAVDLSQDPVFSPGTACPTGYESKCAWVGDGVKIPTDSSATVWPWKGLPSDGTAIACCTSGFVCHSGFYYGCLSTLSGGESVTATTAGDQLYVRVDKYTSATIIALQLIYIPGTPSTTAAGSSTTVTTTSTTAVRNATANNTTGAAHNGLSTGQKAAIGVCIPLAAIGLLVALLFVFRRRRQAKTTSGAAASRSQSDLDALYQPVPVKNGTFQAAELPAATSIQRHDYTPPQASEISELAGSPMVSQSWSDGQAAAAGIRRKPLTGSPVPEGQPPSILSGQTSMGSTGSDLQLPHVNESGTTPGNAPANGGNG